PRLCTPDQADRRTWLIAAAYTQLRLARPLVADQRLPWEKPAKPGKLTSRWRPGGGVKAALTSVPLVAFVMLCHGGGIGSDRSGLELRC
ncbi:MAG TPA: hypothetical protein VEF72_07395, partial [Mycobacterium sp.]|nr:hypothetical protein [Mycobacterium sp.]